MSCLPFHKNDCSPAALPRVGAWPLFIVFLAVFHLTILYMEMDLGALPKGEKQGQSAERQSPSPAFTDTGPLDKLIKKLDGERESPDCFKVDDAEDRDRFLVSNKALGCPHGYTFVVNESLCREAGVGFLSGKDCLDHKKGHFGATYPVGCFQNTKNKCTHFNRDRLGLEREKDFLMDTSETDRHICHEVQKPCNDTDCDNVFTRGADKKRFHVVYSSDVGQVEGIQASLASVMNTSEEPARITFHIMVLASRAKRFKRAFGARPSCPGIVTMSGAIVLFHELHSNTVEQVDVMASTIKERGAIDTLENFARFYMHKILEAEIVVYLDADTIVQADLMNAQTIFIASGKSVGFVGREKPVYMSEFLKDPGSCKTLTTIPKTDRCYATAQLYLQNFRTIANMAAYNIGVLFVNLRRWRSSQITERVEQFIRLHNKCNGNLWLGGSQPPLLLALYNRPPRTNEDFVVLDPRLNFEGLGWKDSFKMEHVASAVVLHWNGKRKPWLADGLYSDIWRKHFDQVDRLLYPLARQEADVVLRGGKSGLSREIGEGATLPGLQVLSHWMNAGPAGLPCAADSTYGYGNGNRSIWVKSGCSGVFFVGGKLTLCESKSDNAGNGQNSEVDTSARVECDAGMLPKLSKDCGLMLLTTFFTTVKDWQRQKFVKGSFDKLESLYASAIRNSVRVTVVYDNLPNELITNYSCDFFAFHRADLSKFPKGYGVNDVRFFVFQQLLQRHSEWSSIFIVDAFDVRIGKNPCREMAPDTLYAGIELEKLHNHPWMQKRFEEMGGVYKKWFRNDVRTHYRIVNCGVVGGYRDVMLRFMRTMTEVLLDPKIPSPSGTINVNMAAMNYVAYNHFPTQLSGGFPVHSAYKRYEDTRTDVWFVHK
eukprot:TRINITY_DN70144_c0_g1_i1.p1 TRINITY_DN70144_c0_g1~~TRINITY_DN70144_c0_g1_i1.p1  ORF type:complete len:928 (+),score=124.59 TRINITY_DN70144_c0_g1_i1:142-2784(+)